MKRIIMYVVGLFLLVGTSVSFVGCGGAKDGLVVDDKLPVTYAAISVDVENADNPKAAIAAVVQRLEGMGAEPEVVLESPRSAWIVAKYRGEGSRYYEGFNDIPGVKEVYIDECGFSKSALMESYRTTYGWMYKK